MIQKTPQNLTVSLKTKQKDSSKPETNQRPSLSPRQPPSQSPTSTFPIPPASQKSLSLGHLLVL